MGRLNKNLHVKDILFEDNDVNFPEFEAGRVQVAVDKKLNFLCVATPGKRSAVTVFLKHLPREFRGCCRSFFGLMAFGKKYLYWNHQLLKLLSM